MPSTAIVQTAFIGDVILTTPLFETARKNRHGDKIVAVVRKGCENILENNPFVDKIVIWDKRGRDKGIAGIFRIGKLLRELNIDIALIPHRSLRTSLAMLLSGTKNRVGFSKGGGAFLHTIRVPYRMGIHEVERNLMLAEALGWETESFKPSIFPDDSDREVIDKVLDGIDRYCVFAPGSVWSTKIWPVESYISAGSVFAGRSITVVLSGGESDTNICRAIAENVPGVVNTCGKLTLRQSAELYRRSKFLLTGDTAPQHIGAAAGTRVFSIFGPTVRDFGFWPYSDRSVVIEENMKCRPCGVHGHKTCPIGTHACLKSITYDRIVKVIDEVMSGDVSKN